MTDTTANEKGNHTHLTPVCTVLAVALTADMHSVACLTRRTLLGATPAVRFVSRSIAAPMRRLCTVPPERPSKHSGKFMTPMRASFLAFVGATSYAFYKMTYEPSDGHHHTHIGGHHTHASLWETQHKKPRPEEEVRRERQAAAEARVHASRSSGARDVETRPVYMDVSVNGTPLGRVVFELFWDVAPLTAENFRQLCEGTDPRLSYKGAVFHRIIPGFMVQGGDFTRGDGTGSCVLRHARPPPTGVRG